LRWVTRNLGKQPLRFPTKVEMGWKLFYDFAVSSYTTVTVWERRKTSQTTKNIKQSKLLLFSFFSPLDFVFCLVLLCSHWPLKRGKLSSGNEAMWTQLHLIIKFRKGCCSRSVDDDG
jgi:hypothetical protein